MKIQRLRKKYPKFIYEKYSYNISKNNLEILFDFEIPPDIKFRPKIVIQNIDKSNIKKTGDGALNNLVFNLGLMEMASYWKTTCSPEIEIMAGPLNKEQINWWKDLIIKGLGQFFYENKIDFLKPKFLKISSLNRKAIQTNFNQQAIPDENRGVLIPVGGGKDSIATLELLKKSKKDIQCFSLNPTEAAFKIMKMSDCKKPIIAYREIDKNLLKLNQKGFLNGHTPFSAYLAFLSVLTATIFGQKYIAFSNERSSNEGNVKYLGRIINHQWSKSFEFEQKFRKYSKKYLTSTVEYFSFLRPLYEIQIAKLFNRHSKYFPFFLSCNEAYKTASGTKLPSKKWCGECSKCLFVFAVLYPFLKKKELLKIFGKNLFNNKNLLPMMRQLTGERGFKPLECIGTKKESLAAFYSSWKRDKELPPQKLPFLLNYFEAKILTKYPNLEKELEVIMDSWNNRHNLPGCFKKILQNNLKKV